MDSGNSGSLQSSSGGDEEYDSILHSSGGGATLPPPTTHHQHHPPTSLYDTLSYYDAFPRSPPNPFLNLESTTPWSRSPRPPLDPTCTNDHTGLFPTPSPINSSTNLSPQPVNPFSLATPTTKPSPAPPDPPPPRNSKKRSRASRRAPTTVLTTDTSNFRAMVQEFTGIPTAPFTASSSSSPFPRSRLDIFSGRSSAFHDSLLAPPPYLLRPFAQKVQATSFAPLSCSSSSTSLIDAIASSSSSSSNATSTSSVAAAAAAAATLNASNINIARPISTCTNPPSQTNNYQLPHDLGLNMQNQMLTFHSLLQPPINTTTTPKYTLAPNIIPAFAADKSRSNDHAPQVIPDFGSHVGNLDNGDVNLAGNLSSLVGEGGDQPQLRHGSCKINF